MNNALFIQYVHKRVFVNLDNCNMFCFVDICQASSTTIMMAEAMELRRCFLF